jgi:hypothetical protein
MTPRAQGRLARQFREAALHATPAEAVELDRLHRRYLAGGSATEISGEVRHMLHTQNQRCRLRTKLKYAYLVAGTSDVAALRALELAVDQQSVTVTDAIAVVEAFLTHE